MTAIRPDGAASWRPRPGPLNGLTDVPGLLVGNAHCDAARTGVTVILCESPAVAGADVRGGGPGTREIEALAPENLVGAADAVVLSGGSALGLGAADAVAAALSARGRGLEVAPGHPRVPIVPAAILYDLGPHSAAAFGADGPPHPALARAALEAADRGVALGSVGAGRGAVAGALKGGLGAASLEIAPGVMVAALVAANPVGSVCMPGGPWFWAWPFEIGDEFGGLAPPDLPCPPAPIPEDGKLRGGWAFDAPDGPVDPGSAPGANTAVGVVATNAALTAAECRRLAMMAQDGLARAIRPAHTPFDGDTLFALSSGAATGGPDLGSGHARAARLAALGSAAADCVARAVARGVHAAAADPGGPPAWREVAKNHLGRAKQGLASPRDAS
ncbi:P1 family peptidase [Oceanicella actignis]|uniref:L-aminopeptidase/D-esterase n=1 Tax=Oceanicella actignis TaxID=1189325 RepID=A0A1M7SPX5_9RHOB|nr:P1 family peptidase [Oceanicella actignis]SES66276.1 L-aminopeptidase/D-esterase [Oceanicella actignis]SHN60484.1 L-aminopeptidase/D-esterase [Oceanicella actignis]